MRLIDADALNKELQQRVGSPTEDKLYEVNLCIIATPTIDAIPVSWIENVLKEWLKSSASFEMCGAISAMLVRWQKEQEAQNAKM